MKVKAFSALAVVLSLLAFAETVNLRQLSERVKIRDSALRTFKNVNQIEQISDSMDNLEDGLRGYVLIDDKDELRPLNQSEPKIEHLLKELAEGTRDTPGKINQINFLEAKIKEKFAEWKQTVRLIRSQKVAEAVSIVCAHKSKKLMQDIRNTTNALSEAEENSLQNQLEQLHNKDKSVSEALAAVLTLVSLVLITMSVLIYRFLQEREKSVELLTKNEAKLSSFFDNALVAIHWLDSNGRISRVNKTQARMLGYESEDMIGESIFKFYENKNAANLVLKNLKNRKEMRDFETILRCKDGSFKTALIDIDIHSESGEISDARCFTRDMTRQKLAELEVKESAARTRTLVETAPDAIITFGLSGIIESSNEASGLVFNCQPQFMVGKNLSQFIPEFFSEKNQSRTFAEIGKGQSLVLGSHKQLNGLHNTGHIFPLEVSWSVLNLGQRSVFTAIIRDISEHKDLERRLQLQYAVAQILSESTTVPEMSRRVLASIGEAMNWCAGSVWMADEGKAESTAIRCTGIWRTKELADLKFLHDRDNAIFDSGMELSGKVFESAMPQTIEDLNQDDTFLYSKEATEKGIKAAFAFPILSEDRVIGSFDFFSKECAQVDERMKNTMYSLGNQVGQFMVRKRAEQAQKVADTQFSAVFNQTFQFIGLLDLDGRVLQANQTALAFEKLKASDVVGVPFWLTPWWGHSEEERTKLRATIREVVLERKLVRFETEHYGVDGRKMTVDFSLKPVIEEDGSMPFLIAEGHDITERKEAEKELQASESRFRHMAQSVREIFWIVDFQKGATQAVYVSPAFERVFGRTLQSVQEKPHIVFEMTHPDDQRKLKDVTKRQSTMTQAHEIEYRIIRADGAIRWLWARMNSIVNSNGKITGICGVTTDITERKEAEVRVREFYSTVSHELRTPLTSIRGSLGLIEGGITGEISPLAMQMVKIGRVESDRLIRLINDILDIKKIEAGQLELNKSVLKPRELVANALDAINGMAMESGVSLTSTVKTQENVFADSERLTQVLTNLLSNAIKFSGRGGEVRVSVASKSNERLRFSVIDQGPGIPQQQLHKLFGMFQQLDSSDSRKYGGTGLGLAISKSIVEQHEGEIGVDTSEGEGSVFWFDIPVGQINR